MDGQVGAPAVPIEHKFCQTCGAQIHKAAVVCPKCGVPTPGSTLGGQQGEADASPKNRTVLLVLALFAGYLSAHRFYAGKVGQAIGGLVLIFGLFVVWGVGASMLSLELMMSSYAFLLVLGLWWLVDFIMILSGGYRDSERKPISRW